MLGPSREMVVSLLNSVIKAVSDHSDVFEYSIDEALIRIHEDIDFKIDILSADYPDVTAIEYTMVYNGVTCDMVPCNDYTQEVVDLMKDMIDQN